MEQQQLEITEKKFLHDYHTAFYKLFHLPLDWVGINTRNLTICGQEHCNPLCVKIMATAVGAARCIADDKELIRKGITGKNCVIHRCHAGFYDALIPVFSDDQYVGALCIGQFLHRNPTKKELEKQRKALSFLQFAPGELEKYYAQAPKLSEEQSSGLLELLQTISNQITEFYQQIRFWDSVQGTDSIHFAQRYIRRHYNRPLTVIGIARAVGMSRSHFLHSFTRQTGTSPIAYLNSYRAKQAAELLGGSRQNISEIADICGFGNIYAMNRCFRKLYNCTPSEFRRNFHDRISQITVPEESFPAKPRPPASSKRISRGKS